METENFFVPNEYNAIIPVIGLDVKNNKTSVSRKHYFVIKRIFDIVFSLIGIILLSPLILGVAAAVKLTSKGTAIYKQQRVGRNGKPFTIIKFRTMVNGADNLNEQLTPKLLKIYKLNQKLNDDPRITKIGRILRRTSIDELPQLFNILIGNMSMVGPRPILKEELLKYNNIADEYLSVKPGLTGMWQVCGRSTTTYTERVLLDNDYVQNQSLFVDAKLIFKTFGVVLSRKGAC